MVDRNYKTKIPGVSLPKTKNGWQKFTTLVESAEKLFAESGFYNVSISDICNEADTAVGTFYIYFETKSDIYRYLVESYGRKIRRSISRDIENSNCETRAERERAGIKSFVKLAVETPTLYDIIWGCLSVDKQMFEDYYVSFARSYSRALLLDKDELKTEDLTTLSYALMGISSFLALRAMFENMSDEEIDYMIDHTFMPMIRDGLIK